MSIINYTYYYVNMSITNTHVIMLICLLYVFAESHYLRHGFSRREKPSFKS